MESETQEVGEPLEVERPWLEVEAVWPPHCELRPSCVDCETVESISMDGKGNGVLTFNHHVIYTNHLYDELCRMIFEALS